MARASFWSQFKVLVWKNLLIKKRNKKQTLQEMLVPVYFIAVLAMIKYLVKPKSYSEINNFPIYSLNDTSTFNSTIGGKILVTPDTAYAHRTMEETTKILKSIHSNGTFDVLYFDNQKTAVEAFNTSPEEVIAGVILDYNLSKPYSNLSYAIRMPFPDIASSDPSNIYQDQSQCRDGDGLDRSNCAANTYLYTAFSIIQIAIDTALARLSLNKSEINPPEINVQMMPKPAFVPDASYIQILSSIYFVIAYAPFINFLTVNLVAEKEKKIKEGMRMMGLRDSAFWLSWTFIYAAIIILVTLVVIVIATVSEFFTNSNMFLFFLMLVLYGLSIIGASFSMTPFFSQAQVAGAVASSASMMISLLYLTVSLSRTYTSTGVQYTIPVWARWLLCLLSPVALALAIDQAIYLDIANPDGMTFSTLTEGEFPLIAPLFMLAVDTVMYFFQAVYLDNVIPGEYGPRQPPWYIFMPSYWCRESKTEPFCDDVGNSHSVHVGNKPDDPNVEKVPDDVSNKTAVSIVRLSKVFSTSEGKLTAVNELSLDIYEGQITALLGHNGAGKTTIMNILSGLISQTSGMVTVAGLDVSKPNDMADIRSMTGVCPQHDILFEDLTCLEHLKLFAAIKGVTQDNRTREIQEALNSVGLEEQKDIKSNVLSGGQKRKLSVAIAIVGDPKIIFLDEPTAGMDPHSRRHLWSVLKDKKKGRAVLLSTHFMDEADILADRKAIMNRGSLRCCGSSLFLKNRFGIGYHLNMVVDQDGDTEGIRKLVGDHIPDADTSGRSHGQELDITLPLAQVSKFAGLFNALEEKVASGDNLGILNYGISMTTLEEVFLELEKNTDDEELQEVGKTQKLLHDSDNELHEHIIMEQLGDQSKDGGKPLLEGYALSKQRFLALFKMRFLRNIRNGQLLFYQLILPTILVVIGLMVNKNAKIELQGKNPKSLEIGPYYYSKMMNSPSTSGRFGPIPALLVHDDVDSTSSQMFLGNLAALYEVERFNSSTTLVNNIPHYLGINLSHFEYTPQRSFATEFTSLYNDSAIHAIPAIINLMTNGIFKLEEYLAGKMDNSSFISASSLPWPASYERVKLSTAAFSSVILLAMAFVVIPSSFGVDIVQDRQTKVRSQLRITGVSYNLYWGSYIALDMIKYIIPVLLIIAITFILQVDSLQQGGAMLALILMCVTYIPANLLLSYVLSFGFDKWETAQAVQPLIFFLVGFMPYVPIAVVDDTSSESAASILHTIFCLTLSPYSMFGGVYYIDKVYRNAEMHMNTENIQMKQYFTSNILAAILIPLVHFMLYVVLLRILDTRESGGNMKEAFACSDVEETVHSQPGDARVDDIGDDDDDVRAERQRVQELMKQPKLPVAMVSNLRKEYRKSDTSMSCKKGNVSSVCVAVNSSSFAVDVGEVFGLLGPNGAGKTTTLNVITADTVPTKGEVVVGGYNVRSKASSSYNAMGFCPQHDPLWDRITLKEHLECYSNLRGIKPDEIKTTIDFYKNQLQLKEHMNKQAKKLSGGTKRKLSYCMSMLGQPRFVLMDEPSTGMDPQSKRFLWDTISSSFKAYQRGAILTTHHMEEADALCTRIAIMVNGKLQCIGSSQHLKSKYGSGYLLEIKLLLTTENQASLEEAMQILQQYILHHFPAASCIEEFNERVQYKVPRDNVTSLARAFSILEEAKLRLGVEEYSFSQSTLEQVFLEFAKKQLDEAENVQEL